jgi:hypothetical protein
MIPKSGNRFSEKIMLHKKLERDGDSKKSHPALEPRISDSLLGTEDNPTKKRSYFSLGLLIAYSGDWCRPLPG